MATSKGFKWITNNIEHKYILEKDINQYLENGWHLGMNDNFKQKISKSLKGIPSGKCKDPQKELERKQKNF